MAFQAARHDSDDAPPIPNELGVEGTLGATSTGTFERVRRVSAHIAGAPIDGWVVGAQLEAHVPSCAEADGIATMYERWATARWRWVTCGAALVTRGATGNRLVAQAVETFL